MDISGGSKVGNESRRTITEFSKSKSIQRGSKATDLWPLSQSPSLSIYH